MKKFLLAAAIFLVAQTSFAGGDRDLSVKSLWELPVLTESSIDPADYQIVYDASNEYRPSRVPASAHGLSAFNICGEATTINNNTIYYGPGITLTANTFTGQNCDIDATGNATEATADAPIYTNQAVNVLGMTCRNEADANANISYTLRTAAGATTPSVTCTIADGERDCVADVQTTTAIAAGATVAIAGASTSNVADNNGFICTVYVSY